MELLSNEKQLKFKHDKIIHYIEDELNIRFDAPEIDSIYEFLSSISPRGETND